jgi:hypothetical protein
MKHLYTLIVMGLLFSCSSERNTGERDFAKMRFSLDTVMVDPGEEIINLKNGLFLSVLSSDKKLLYNFDPAKTVFEKINLDRLVLEEKIPFEKEGPNGTGQYLSNISMDNNNQLQLTNYQSTGIFTLKGQKIREIKLLKQVFEGDQLKDGESFAPELFISTDGKKLFGLIRSYTEKGYALGVVDLESNILKRHELEDFSRTQDYHVKLVLSGNAMSIKGVIVRIQEHRGKYLISNEIFNTMVLYDPALDSLSYIRYDNTLTENSKKGNYRKEVDSHQAFSKEINLIEQEINFSAPLWDDDNKIFYRFSYQAKPLDENTEEHAPQKYDIFLTILDASFKVLGESRLNALSKLPSKPFVKNGKIWLFENIDDELGFVRLTVNR